LFSLFRGETPLKRENVKERVLLWRGVAGCSPQGWVAE
jgi:hypothetical protein